MKQLLPLLLLVTFSSQAQNLLHCGADEIRIQTLQANPKIAQAVVERDAELDAFTIEYALRQAQGSPRGGQLYTIPVVFHVIHKFGNENISREQILDGLRILNETFRKTREDTADIHPDFKPIHADTEIEFALATKDPEGNCHSGINRIASDLTNSGDHRVKDLVHWNPSMYLNVYVVSNAAGLAGHCVWPADADTIPAWDGIVIAHSYVGTIGTSDLTRSVAFAHECGHYLNLHHIWGGNNVPNFYYLPVGQASNCGEDDLVDDTPNTIGWSTCNLNAASCGNARDNVQNAMDYSYCNIMFTEGQKTRMRAALNSPIANRHNLWTPANLIATGVTPQAGLCAADFEADQTFFCGPNGGAVTFTNTSYHGETDSVYWEFPGGDSPFSLMEEPIVVYYQPGSFDVSLTVYSNGNSATVTKENYITLLSDSSWSYPFSDSFENNPLSINNKWHANAASEDSFWAENQLAASSGTQSLLVNNWLVNRLTINELYGPPIDLSGATQMKLAFKYAYAASELAATGSKLLVQVSRNCETNWSTRLSLTGAGLETADPQTAPFVPTELQWNQEVVNIPSTYLEDGFRFRFSFTSNGNNRLFLDDINIDLTAGIEDSWLTASHISIYPNPTSELLNVNFTLPKAADVAFSIVDVLGKTLISTPEKDFTLGTNTVQLDVNELASGVYFLRLESGNNQSTKRFIIF
ncbi:MAG: T9SS type A sorting domain-containing protein [Flavobacteriales bacterium]|nr:T9SS type A sorting domain-containing protein [Flavobacteriales bacterium]